MPGDTSTRAAIGILLLGGALRFAGVLSLPYEQDELYTVHEATYLFHSKLRPGIEGRPLYFLMQHAVLQVAPPSPLSLRLLPLAFGMVGLWLTWVLGRRAFGPTGGLVAALLAALSPWHLYESGFARYYAMLYALGAGAFLLLPQAVDRDRPRDYLAVLAAFVLGSATHPSFAFPVLGAVLAVSLVRPDGTLEWRWPSATAWRWLWGPFAALLLAGYLALRFTSHADAFRNWGGRGLLATLRLVPAMVQWLTPTVALAAALGALLMAAGAEPRYRRWGWMATLGCGGTAAIMLLASLRTDVYADYGTTMLPLVFVTAGGLVQWGVDTLPAAKTGFAWTAVALLLAGVLPSTISHLSDGTRFDYRPAYRRIAREAPQLAVLTQPLALQQQYGPGLRAYQLKANPAYLDSLLTRERDLWAVISVQRYGIVGDPNGRLRDWLNARCRLVAVHEPLRLDYRTYRVELHRFPGESGAALRTLSPNGTAGLAPVLHTRSR